MTLYLEEMKDTLNKRVEEINKAYEAITEILNLVEHDEHIAVDPDWFTKTIIDIGNTSEQNTTLLWDIMKKLEDMGVVCTLTTETYINKF